jgi:hypothetical protein
VRRTAVWDLQNEISCSFSHFLKTETTLLCRFFLKLKAISGLCNSILFHNVGFFQGTLFGEENTIFCPLERTAEH